MRIHWIADARFSLAVAFASIVAIGVKLCGRGAYSRKISTFILCLRFPGTVVLAFPFPDHPLLLFLFMSINGAEAVIYTNSRLKAACWALSPAALLFALPRRGWGIQTPDMSLPVAAAAAVGALCVIQAVYALQFYSRENRRIEEELFRRQRLIDQVYHLNTRFQDYALDAGLRSAENERRRITRDIHDIMGYTLVNLRVMLEVALDLAPEGSERLRALLSDAITHTREGLQSARADLRNLRSIDQGEESWMTRLYRIARTFSSATETDVSVDWGNVTRTNCPRLKTAVFQFVQEALTNAYKHGNARSISIGLRITGEAPADSLSVRVVDDGAGAADVTPGLGFSGIAERIQLLDGTTGYRSLDGGFEVWISIPMLSLRKDI